MIGASWLGPVGTFLCICGGVALGDYLYLAYFFGVTEPAPGYLRRTFCRLRTFHLAALAARALAVGAVTLLLPYGLLEHLKPWAPFVVGALAGLLTTGPALGVDLYFAERGSEQTYKRKLFRAVSRLVRYLNVALRQRYSAEVQKQKEHDNYDLQHGEGFWALGLSREEVRRRIQALWEESKEEIATKSGSPALLALGPRVSPFQRFYPLVAHCGREDLRRRIVSVHVEPPPPGQSVERPRTGGDADGASDEYGSV